jgi:5S rRNA maturation endonuclease (ribonuclease M5)
MIISLSNFEAQHRDNFLNFKKKLFENDYPIFETQNFVGFNYAFVRSVFIKSIPENSILINVPSSTGKNIIPSVLASFIRDDIKNTTFIESNANFIATNKIPSKHGLSFSERSKDPILFQSISQNKLNNLKTFCENKKVFILEDWFSSGESAVNFKRELEKQGIKVENICALICNKKYLCHEKDISPMIHKLKNKSNLSEKDFSITMIANFKGFSQHKLTKFFWEISNANPEKATTILKSLSYNKDNYLNNGLISNGDLNKSFKLLSQQQTREL